MRFTKHAVIAAMILSLPVVAHGGSGGPQSKTPDSGQSRKTGSSSLFPGAPVQKDRALQNTPVSHSEDSSRTPSSAGQQNNHGDAGAPGTTVLVSPQTLNIQVDSMGNVKGNALVVKVGHVSMEREESCKRVRFVEVSTMDPVNEGASGARQGSSAKLGNIYNKGLCSFGQEQAVMELKPFSNSELIAMCSDAGPGTRSPRRRGLLSVSLRQAARHPDVTSQSALTEKSAQFEYQIECLAGTLNK